MPRPKKPIDASLTGPVVEFAKDLRERRARAGTPAYAKMAQIAHSSVPTLSTADNGEKLPTASAVEAYVCGCGADPGEVEKWLKKRAKIEAHLRGRSPSPTGRARVPNPERLPDPRSATTVAGLRSLLKGIQKWAGDPSYKELQRRAEEEGFDLPSSTIGDMLSPMRTSLPRQETMLMFLGACHVPGEYIEALVDTHQTLKAQQTRSRLANRTAKVPPQPAVDDPPVAGVPLAFDDGTSSGRQMPSPDQLTAGAGASAVGDPQTMPGYDRPAQTPPTPVEKRRVEHFLAIYDSAVTWEERQAALRELQEWAGSESAGHERVPDGAAGVRRVRNSMSPGLPGRARPGLPPPPEDPAIGRSPQMRYRPGPARRHVQVEPPGVVPDAGSWHRSPDGQVIESHPQRALGRGWDGDPCLPLQLPSPDWAPRGERWRPSPRDARRSQQSGTARDSIEHLRSRSLEYADRRDARDAAPDSPWDLWADPQPRDDRKLLTPIIACVVGASMVVLGIFVAASSSTSRSAPAPATSPGPEPLPLLGVHEIWDGLRRDLYGVP